MTLFWSNMEGMITLLAIFVLLWLGLGSCTFL